MLATDRGEYAQATALLTEALGLFRALDAGFWVGFILNALGIVTYEQGDTERAAALFTEALAQFRTVGETNGTAYALTNLGKIALASGDNDQAAAYYQESLALRQERGEEMSISGCFRGLAIVAVQFGKFEEAAGLFGAAEALRERIGLPPPRHHARYEQAVTCRAALGNERLLILWSKGHDWSWRPRWPLPQESVDPGTVNGEAQTLSRQPTCSPASKRRRRYSGSIR